MVGLIFLWMLTLSTDRKNGTTQISNQGTWPLTVTQNHVFSYVETLKTN